MDPRKCHESRSGSMILNGNTDPGFFDQLRSPTACYLDPNVESGVIYRDQQDCVVWWVIQWYWVILLGMVRRSICTWYRVTVMAWQSLFSATYCHLGSRFTKTRRSYIDNLEISYYWKIKPVECWQCLENSVSHFKRTRDNAANGHLRLEIKLLWVIWLLQLSSLFPRTLVVIVVIAYVASCIQCSEQTWFVHIRQVSKDDGTSVETEDGLTLASSIPEFFLRIFIENEIWFKTSESRFSR